MPIICTVQCLANAYAAKGSDASREGVAGRAFNFKVTCFNVASAALITSLALAILAKSVLLFGVAFIVLKTRKAFARNIEATDYRSLEQKVSLQVFDFVVFRRGAVVEQMPQDSPSRADQGAARHRRSTEEASPVASPASAAVASPPEAAGDNLSRRKPSST
jgi:hypothetical protein